MATPCFRIALFAAAVALLAGCLGSGPDGGRRGTETDGDDADLCGARDEQSRSESPPGLARRADADTPSEADGNRTLRWDLAVDGACQEEQATVSVQVTLGEPPADCPAVAWRASVTTALSERDLALAGTTTLQGSETFRPSRTDLGAGPGSYVLSLSATFADRSALQDEACLDAQVQGLQLATSYALAV
jgi:hypothetical protein